MTENIKYPNNRLKLLREARELSVRQLADRTGIDPTTISKCERGQRNFSANCIKQLSSFFGVSIDYFLGKDPEAIFSDFVASLEDFLVETTHSDGSVVRGVTDLVPEPTRTKLDIVFLLAGLSKKESLDLIYDVALRRSTLEDFEEDLD